jgi:hypothetical protein
MSDASEITVKKFVVIPRDAMDLLMRRHASLEDAISAGEIDCGETGMTMVVVELRAVIARADRPVKVKKL